MGYRVIEQRDWGWGLALLDSLPCKTSFMDTCSLLRNACREK